MLLLLLLLLRLLLTLLARLRLLLWAELSIPYVRRVHAQRGACNIIHIILVNILVQNL